MRKIKLYCNEITNGLPECPFTQWSLHPWVGDFANYQGYTGDDAEYAIPNDWYIDDEMSIIRDGKDVHCELYGKEYPCVYDLSGKHDLPKIGSDVSVASASWILGISEQRVRQLIDSGALKARRIGKRVLLIDWDSFEKYSESEHKPGRPKNK